MTKQQNIQAYIDTIIGGTVTTKSLSLATSCTLPTLLTFIKNNPNRFRKIKHGTYLILSSAVSTDTTEDINVR
jgi:hypothetical protein